MRQGYTDPVHANAISEFPKKKGELPTLKKSGLPASVPAACSGKPAQVLR